MGKTFEYVEDDEAITLVFNGEKYLVSGIAPAGVITDLAAVMDMESDSEKVEAVTAFFEKVLLPESVEAFRTNLRNPAKPIGFKSLLKSFEDLVEEYTEEVRPTEDPSGSPDGSETTGSSSTGSAPSEEASTPDALVSTGA